MRVEELKRKFPKVFVGSQFAVALLKYEENQVGVQIFCEDDEYWSPMNDGSWFSAYWIPDLHHIVNEAQEWLVENCDPFIDENSSGAQMGWLWRQAK